ncbi:MAG: hypothetical protein P0Y52_07960 [Candidatus Brevundimonas phytovorans]|nr:hypothetical protein [Brevundimonas sp.]WEK56493.1 MAG: hypothetical protein P0Y52_07960 [Brevundimonas sp.]
MPQLALAAASFTASAAPAVAATAAKVGFMTTLKSVAMNVLTNVAISAAMSALQPQVGAAGRTFEWTLDPDGPIPFAAGRIGVPGSAVYRKTFGPDLMYYGIPSVLSGAGPIDGFEGVRADDETVAFDATGMAITSQYAGELWYRNRLGAQPDTALVSPTGLKKGASLPGWTSAHRLSGKASYLLVMGENSKGTAYPTGEVKPIITFRGLLGWDPRRDSTYPGGSGACRLNDPSTWVYITNPILWALKWALGLWEGPTGKGAPQVDYQVGGIGAKLSGIDVPAFVAAANVADANAWTVGAYPTTDDDKSQVLDAFLQAGGAIYAQRAGKISCIQRASIRASIVTISAADTAGPLEIDTAASRIDRINTIRPRFWSEAHRWQLTAIDEVTAAAYQTEDGAKRTRGIDYPYVTNAKQAAQLAALQIANTREGIAGVIPLKPHLQRIRPGDAFTITEPGFVLNGVKCLCLTTDYDPATGVVRVSFVSETDGKYAFAMGQNPTPPSPPVLTPVDPTYVSPPEIDDWTIVVRPPSPAGGQLPGFDLGGIVSNDTATAIIVEHGPTAAGPWTQAYQGPPTVTKIPVDGLQPGATYYVAVQYQRNQNYSARQVYGPYTAPLLDPSPTAPTIVAMQDAIDAAETGLGSLNAAIYTPGTGLLARSDAMFASLNTPTTGVLARLTAAETAITTNDTASTTRLVALEATVNTAGTGLVARMGVQEAATANLATGKADASRVTALEAKVDTPGTGLLARMASQETATIDLQTQKADVSRVQLLEAFAAGGDGVMKDGGFQLWPAANARPDNVGAPTGLTISRQTTGLIYGDKAMRLVDPGTGNASFPIVTAGFAPASDALYWVVEYQVTVNSGDLKRFGVQFRANRTTGYYGSTVDLAINHPTTTPGVTYRGSKMFTVAPLGGAAGMPTTCQGYFYTNLASFSGGAFSAKDLTLHRLQFRQATPEEIATGSVLPDVASRVATLETATANLQTGKADASRVTSLEATVNTPGTGVTARLTTVESVAASANGTAKAIKGVVLDVNGYVSGFSSTNDGTTSAFEILASAFGIRDPGAGERTEYRAGNWYVYSPTENTRTRYGKAFGGTQKLVWWTGPTSVAEGSETKANAYVYMSQNAVSGPRFGGSDVPVAGVGTAAAGRGAVTGTISNTTFVTVASVTFANRAAAGFWTAAISGLAASTSGVDANLEFRVIEQGASSPLASSLAVVPGGGSSSLIDLSLSPAGLLAQTRPAGAITLNLQGRRTAGTGTVTISGGDFNVTYTPSV